MLAVSHYLDLADERLSDAYEAAASETLTDDEREIIAQQLRDIRDQAWAIAEQLKIQL